MRTRIIVLLIALVWASQVLAQDPAPEAETAARESYRVGIEDVLAVVVWGEPDLSMSLRVRPDGRITLPLVNDIEVVNLSTIEIRDLLTEKLAEFVQSPNVTVILEEMNSFRVFVLGEVASQGMLQFQRPTRFLQALASAGGLTEFSKKDAVILRSVNGSDWRMPVDLKKLLSGSSSTQDPYLEPNDTILVF